MVVEWFLEVLVTIWEGLCALMPDFGPPSWFTASDGFVSDVLAYSTGMGAWVPMGLGVTVLLAVLTCVVVGFAIKGVRIAASFLTAGGGSAG